MRKCLEWIWNRGIVSTFLAGLFAILPIVITVAIVSWVALWVHGLLGPETAVGRLLRGLGLHFVDQPVVASIIGWVVVLVGIWLLGLLVKSEARERIEGAFRVIVNRIPIVKGVYGTASQVVGMLRKDEQAELKAMSVVYCAFGGESGAGFLALLASPEAYRFGGRDCHLVYIPTSPLPMSGGIIFVPLDAVSRVDMSAEHLMQIYFSLGTLAPQVMPEQHRAAQPVRAGTVAG